jgi:hypothetical protein
MSRRHLFSAFAVALVCVATVAACGDGAEEGPAKVDSGTPDRSMPEPERKKPGGSPCEENSECESNECYTRHDWIGGVCAGPCTTDDDCIQVGAGGSTILACGLTEGERRCIENCDQQGISCRDGYPVRCSEVGQEYCEDCGCPEGLACWPGKGCQAPAEVGMPCESDEHCESQNCSKEAHVCRVAIGEPCTADNCDLCIKPKDAEAYCSRECSGRGCSDGWLCTSADAVNGPFHCRRYCAGATDPECPGYCGGVEGTNAYVCQCFDCEVLSSQE